MTPSPESVQTHFRFLDLPPELRNRVYRITFEDAAPYELNLMCKLDDPPAAITATSRQLRQESLGLHQQAVSDFWANHEFFIHLGDGTGMTIEGAAADELLRRSRNLPDKGLRRLHFLLVQYMEDGTEREVLWFHGLVVLDDEEQVTVKMWVTADGPLPAAVLSSEPTSEATANVMTANEEDSMAMVLEGESAGLDVVRCTAMWAEISQRAQS